MFSKQMVFVAVLCLAAAAANANSVSYSASIPLSSTNWASSVSLQKFDSALGALNSITCTLDGYVQGSAKFESLDATPATVTMNLEAWLRLKRPDGTLLVLTMPVASTSDNVTAFDGTIDYAGTSGRTYDNLSANSSNSFTTSSDSDKVLFTGTGNILLLLPVTAQGYSSGTGAGNLSLNFQTLAAAGATVTYDYTPVVPEPLTMFGLVAGLGGLAGYIRRRRMTVYEQ